jgi:hypothetical protein
MEARDLQRQESMSAITAKASAGSIARAQGRPIFVGAALLAISWLVYRPDRVRPIHIIDFSEFVPILQRAAAPLDQVRAIVEYYASQGRFNVVTYILLVLKWDFFGWWSPGWQVARAIIMALLFVLTFVLLRRLGASTLGAMIGGSVYLWAPSASEGWIRMTVAEPLGALIILAAAVRATRFQQIAKWQREAGLMAVAAIALIWTKELLAPLLLLPVSLALCVQPDGSMAPPQWSRRNTGLVAAVAIASVLAMLPIVVVWLNGGESAYATFYGRNPQSLTGLLAFWFTGLIPFELIVSPTNILWAIAVTSFTVLVGTGWRAGFKNKHTATRARWMLALSTLLPLIGVLVYLPVSWYSRFYFIPYLFGTAILVGMAATWLQWTSRKSGRLAILAWVAMSLDAVMDSASYAASVEAVQRRDAWVGAFVADSVSADTVQVATTVAPPFEWLGVGSLLRRMSGARGHDWPPTRNVSCDSARKNLESSPRLLTINLASSCEFKSARMKVLAQPFRRVDLRTLRLVVDSVHADIVLPVNRGRLR